MSVIAELIQDGGQFVAADAPLPTKYTIIMLAGIAQEESWLISERMMAVRGDVPIEVVSKRLGLSTIEVTESRDMHVFKQRDEAASESLTELLG